MSAWEESVEKHCFRTPACDGPPSPEQKDPYPELIDVPWIHTPPHTFSEMAVRALSRLYPNTPACAEAAGIFGIGEGEGCELNKFNTS